MSDRIEAMAAMYKGGRTLQQIGDLFGITRERVRQLIKKKGMTGKDGGARISSAAGRAERMARLLARREEKAKRIYGVSHQEALALNGGMSLRDPESLATKYRQKKANALRKAHDWDLTFRGYVSAIQESGLDLGCHQF